MPITREMPEQTFQDAREVDYLYRITSTTKLFDDIGRKVYGIEVRYGDITERIEDISSSKDIVITLLQKLITEKCSPMHFRDVVEDFVTDYII